MENSYIKQVEGTADDFPLPKKPNMKRPVKNTVFDNSNKAIPGKQGKSTDMVVSAPGFT